MELPREFLQNLYVSFGRAATDDWIARLPRLLAESASRWDLELGAPVDGLSYNYVCFATRPSTSPGLDTLRYSTNGSAQDCVLKLGIPNRELTSEMECLSAWGGMAFRPAVRLLESDPENGLLLLERLRPGETLATIPDDDRATEIAADVMSRLWIPLPEVRHCEEGVLPDEAICPSEVGLLPEGRNDGMKSGGNQISDSANFILLKDWFAELQKLRPLFNGGTGKFPARLVETAEGLIRELFAEEETWLIHGDLHHYNILSHGGEWRVIDPKGVVGAREYEVAPFMLNPLYRPRPSIKRETARRLDIFSERLGLDRQHLWAWTVAHSLLSAWWDLQEDGTGGDFTLACGEAFLDLQTPKG